MSHVLSLGATAVVPLISDTLNNTIDEALRSAVQRLPGVTGALVVLLLGYVIGSRLKTAVVDICYRTNIDQWFVDSPIAPLLGEQPGSASRAVGTVVQYYVYLFAALIAADIAAFQELNPWLETLIVWVPNALAGVAVILVGLVLTDYAVRQTRASSVVERSEFGVWIPAVVRAVLYVVVFVIGLDMIGINLEIVYLIVDGIASAIGLGITAAIALGLGVAAGLLAKDYVDRELDERADAAED